MNTPDIIIPLLFSLLNTFLKKGVDNFLFFIKKIFRKFFFEIIIFYFSNCMSPTNTTSGINFIPISCSHDALMRQANRATSFAVAFP